MDQTTYSELGCRDVLGRFVLALVFLICAACTYTRNAPLIADQTIKLIQIDNSPIANGNTVPVSAVP